MITVSLPSTSTPLGDTASITEPSATATPLTADWIDPQTNDYASVTRGFNAIDAQVIIALKTDRGSGVAVAEVGNTLADIRKMGRSFEDDVRAAIRVALREMIRRRDIRLTNIAFDLLDEGNQAAHVRVEWQNLRDAKGSTRSVALPVS